MAIVNTNTPTKAPFYSPAPASTNVAAMALVTALFFFWGFVTVLNDILVPHLKSIFDLNYTKVMLIQFAFFSAYLFFPFPPQNSSMPLDTKRPWSQASSPWA
jgi:MFS transporter, FHS family, L-fucose permease